jgi:hypothetical protein
MANAHSPVPPKVKLTYHQRQRLISQGRCFTCRQKGHRSQDCKRSLNSPLAKLPVEILEAICTNLVYPCGKMFDVPFIWFMYDLRLACREINAKTLSFFHREGFRTMLVKSTYKGFQKLSEISNYPPFASKIERLSFSTIDEEMMEPEEYAQLQAQLLNTSLNLQQRQEIAMRIHDIDLMQTDKAFMDTSAAGGIMLNMALRNMANLQDIRIHCLTNEEWPGQQGMPSNELTISRRFSMILSSLAFSGTKLRVLQVVGFGYGSAAHGVSIQALCVPSEFLPCLSELRSLYLPLETTDLFLPSEYCSGPPTIEGSISTNHRR